MSELLTTCEKSGPNSLVNVLRELGRLTVDPEVIVRDVAASVGRQERSKLAKAILCRTTLSVGKTRRTVSNAILLVTESRASLVAHNSPHDAERVETELGVA
jgi:hypothetical protein